MLNSELKSAEVALDERYGNEYCEILAYTHEKMDPETLKYRYMSNIDLGLNIIKRYRKGFLNDKDLNVRFLSWYEDRIFLVANKKKYNVRG